MRTISCPICKALILYEADGKIYPNLQGRIDDHLNKHRLEDITKYYYDTMYAQAIKHQDELEQEKLASNTQKETVREK